MPDEKIIDEAERDGIRRYAVGGIICKNGTVLLLRRRKNDFLGGIYDLPGGKVESNESLKAALSREVEEETSLRVRAIKRYLGFFDYKSEDGERTRVFNFHVEVARPLRIRLQEHDRFVWADKAKLAELRLTEEMSRVLGIVIGWYSSVS